MISWISENICEYFTDQISGAIALFGDKINNIFYATVDAGVSNAYVVNANTFLVVFALAAVALIVGKEVLDGDLIDVNYDPDDSPMDFLLRIAEAVAVISCFGALFDYLMVFSKRFASDLLGSSNATGVKDITSGLINIDLSNTGSAAGMYITVVMLVFIGFIVFAVVSGFRGAELIAMKMFAVIFALDLIHANRERWNNFFMAFLLAMFSYGFQTLFYILSLKSYASASINDMGYCLSAIGWLLMAIIGPHFIEKYLYKSGISKAAGSGLRMLAQTAMIKA